jgi:hypothetical protein
MHPTHLLEHLQTPHVLQRSQQVAEGLAAQPVAHQLALRHHVTVHGLPALHSAWPSSTAQPRVLDHSGGSGSQQHHHHKRPLLTAVADKRQATQTARQLKEQTRQQHVACMWRPRASVIKPLAWQPTE